MLAAVISLGLGAAVVLVAHHRGWGWTAPMNLYAAAWAMAVALYSLRLYPFYDLSPATWALVAGAGLAFVGAAFLAGSSRDKERHSRAPAPGAPRAPSLVIESFLSLGLCGSALFLWRVSKHVGLAAFFDAPIVVHAALTERRINPSYLFLYYFGVAGAILFGYALFVLKSRPRLISVALLILFLLGMSVSTERTQFLWVTASWMFLSLAPPAGDGRARKVVRAAVVAGLVGASFYLIVGNWLGKSPDNIAGALQRTAIAKKEGPAESSGTAKMALLLPGGALHKLSVLYMAVAAPLPALEQIVGRNEPLSYGRQTFHPIWRALARMRLVRAGPDRTVYEEVPTPYPTNVFSYLYEYYLDFGWPGVLLWPALLGFLSGFLYRRTASRPTSATLWPLLLAQMQVMILWTPFQNRFVNTVNWYMLVLLILAATVMDRYRRSAALEAAPAGCTSR